MNRLTIILTIIFAVAGSAMATAVDYPTYKPTTPQYTTPVYSVAEGSLNEQQASFNSTSSYSKQLDESATRRSAINPFDASGMQIDHSYTVPVAASAVTGGVTTVDLNGENNVQGVRRARHNPGDPNDILNDPDMPVGDTPWFFMFLLALAFTAFRSFRKERILSNNQ
jgi:hypothetical protein